MDGSPRETVRDIENYDQDVRALVGESQELEKQNVDNTEADLTKDETTNESPSCGYIDSSNSGDVITHDEIDESAGGTTNEELDVKEEPESDHQLQTDTASDHDTEDIKVSIEDDVLALFPFVCGICYEKFNSLATYYMHISLHENVSVFLHSCELLTDGIDNDSVLFSCGICEIKFPTLCTLYEHLLTVEGLTDFVYKDREKTAYAYVNHARNLEMTKDIAESHRDRETSEYMLSNTTKELDISTNISEISTTRKQHYTKNMQDSFGEDSDNTIICENFDENNVGIGRKYMQALADTERNFRKILNRGKTERHNVKRNKKGKKQQVVRKDLLIKKTGNNLKKCKSKNDLMDDDSFETETENEKFKHKSSSQRKTKSDGRSKKEIGTDKDFFLLGKTSVSDGNKGEKHGSESQEDTSTGENTKESQEDTAIGENTKQAKKMQIRTGQQFPCEICGALMLHEYLTRHLQTHGDKTISCDHCDTKFACKSNLKTHMRQVHTEEKKYTCDTCGKSFKAWPYLKQHRLTHIKEKNEQCPVCPAKFKYAGLLKVHMKSHSDNAPFSCDVCGKKFKRGYPLKLHKISHSDVRKFPCPECKKMFKQKGDMKKHFRIHLPPKYFCEVCGKSFVDKTNMRTHMKVHGKFK